MKLKFCDECEEFVEPQDGRCPNCNEKLVLQDRLSKFDEWEDEDKEWGTQDEAEEIEEVTRNG